MKFIRPIIIIAIILGVSFVAYENLKPKKPAYKTAEVAVGDLQQEVSETGVVKKGDIVKLGFKNSGQIESIDVGEGQAVSAGQLLARLDTRQLKIQLAQAQSALAISQTNLDKLVNGASEEDIRLAQTAVENAATANNSAQRALDDAIAAAEENRAGAYQTGYDAMQSSYSAAYNAYNFTGLLQRTYFSPRDPDSIKVWESYQKISGGVVTIKKAIDAAISIKYPNEIDSGLAVTADKLAEISDLLRDVRDICENSTWRNTVSTADKNSLDTQRGLVVAALSSANTAIQQIAAAKAANDTAVNAARAARKAAEGQLKVVQDQLAKISAPARTEDVELLKSQVAASRANVSLLETQIGDAELKSPLDGQIAKINKKAGEIAGVLDAEGVISILPADPFTVDVDIYEEDIVKIAIGDNVEIVLAAVPDKMYLGKVSYIDPVEKIINGVVYYPVTLNFTEIPEFIKTGMSADIAIKPAAKNGVLVVPESAIKKIGTKYFATVLKDGQTAEVTVTVGINASGQIEIISGLSAGDQVIIP